MDRIVATRSFHSRADIRVSYRDALEVITCPLRYVMDPDAARQCGDLLRDCPELMEIERSVLRMPAGMFWLEWPAEPDPSGSGGGEQIGCVVRASEDGRSGSIQPFFSDTSGQVSRLPGDISFDLDAMAHPDPDGSRATFKHDRFHHLNDVLSSAALRLNRDWMRRNLTGDPNRRLSQEAEKSWFFLPFLLTFSVLLSSPNILNMNTRKPLGNRETFGSRIPKTLEHYEVSMHLGEFSMDGGKASNGASRTSRETPRLHLVRGHYVQRGGKTFWRVSHMRGSGEWAGFDKTVRVKGARPQPLVRQ